MLLGLHGVSGVADGEALWCVGVYYTYIYTYKFRHPLSRTYRGRNSEFLVKTVRLLKTEISTTTAPKGVFLSIYS